MSLVSELEKVMSEKKAGKKQKTTPFAERVENALEKAGINPADWSDEEIGGPEGEEAWRDFEDKNIQQAGRMEWTRRRRQRGELDENGYTGVWLR